MGLKRPWRRHAILIVALLLVGCSLQPTTRVHAPTPTPTQVAPTPSPTSTPYSYPPFRPLEAQVVTIGPVYVTGDSTVPRLALDEAAAILRVMLQHRPDIVQTLRAQGAFTVVAPRDKHICDLTYFSSEPPSLCALFGYGGAGAISGLPVTACGERNLLKEPDDPYLRGQQPVGQNICLHELAHMVMNIGVDDADRARIVARYEAANSLKLWEGDYANTNAMEFWAVMTQFYFSGGPNAPYASFHHIANGPDALKRYDPDTFALLDSVYQGSADLR